MRQRVTIGLATICRPEFIIADEPTTALDVVLQKDVLRLIRDIRAELGSSIVFVTHDMFQNPFQAFNPLKKVERYLSSIA